MIALKNIVQVFKIKTACIQRCGGPLEVNHESRNPERCKIQAPLLHLKLLYPIFKYLFFFFVSKYVSKKCKKVFFSGPMTEMSSLLRTDRFIEATEHFLSTVKIFFTHLPDGLPLQPCAMDNEQTGLVDSRYRGPTSH